MRARFYLLWAAIRRASGWATQVELWVHRWPKPQRKDFYKRVAQKRASGFSRHVAEEVTYRTMIQEFPSGSRWRIPAYMHRRDK